MPYRPVEIVNYLRASDTDVLVLSEFKKSLVNKPFEVGLTAAGFDASTSFTEALVGLGYRYKSISNTDGPSDLGVAVFSRLSSTPFEIHPHFDDAGRIAALDTGSIVVAGVYQNRYESVETKETLFKYLNGPPPEFVNRRVLLTGDFNTGRDDVDREEGGTKYFCADLFSQMTERGWVDLWRIRHGEQAREYTWMSRCSGFRLDHAFGRGGVETKVADCYYDHGTRGAEPKLSDHSAMIVEIE